MSDWWTDFFDDAFPAFYDDPAAAEDIASALVAGLGLSAGSRVFDQCCGFGRLTLALAARGLDCVGLDICDSYISMARERAAKRGLDVELIVGDAFERSIEPRCDAVINWSTSFGYADDLRNARMLARARASLVPGGVLALDFPNVPRVLRDFRPTMVDRRTGEDGETLRIREAEVNLVEGTLEQTWTYVMPDGARIHRRGTTRLYMPHQLASMLRSAGFASVELCGDLEGSALELDSPRCVCIARAPS